MVGVFLRNNLSSNEKKRASGVTDARLLMDQQTCLLSLRTMETQCSGTVRKLRPPERGGICFSFAQQIGIGHFAYRESNRGFPSLSTKTVIPPMFVQCAIKYCTPVSVSTIILVPSINPSFSITSNLFFMSVIFFVKFKFIAFILSNLLAEEAPFSRLPASRPPRGVTPSDMHPRAIPQMGFERAEGPFAGNPKGRRPFGGVQGQSPWVSPDPQTPPAPRRRPAGDR